MQPLELTPPRQSSNGGDAPNVFFLAYADKLR